MPIKQNCRHSALVRMARSLISDLLRTSERVSSNMPILREGGARWTSFLRTLTHSKFSPPPVLVSYTLPNPLLLGKDTR
jgi:hypothetical protein